MKASKSLQKELVYGLTVGMVVLWLLATIISGLVVRRELDKAFDNAMQDTAQRILPLAVLEIINRDEGATPQKVPSLNTEREGFAYLVRDGQGNILMQSQGAGAEIFSSKAIQGFSTTDTHRLYGASALRNTLFLQMAEPLAHRREAALKAAASLLLPLLILIPSSLLGIWILVRLSLRSVRVYSQAIESRGTGDLSEINPEKLPVELVPIADAVNHLIGRLQNALEAERRFTENSAHELRTPLAAALAQIQRLQREVPEGPLQGRVIQIEKSLKDLARLSEKLLQLAKAEGGGLLSEVPQDLSVVLRHVVQDLQRNSPVSIELKLPPTGQVLSMIDPDAFAILVRNLIENALKHGAPDHKVEIGLSSDARLTVSNRGDVVSGRDLARLSQRFVRSESRAEGFGLGLAIVATIVQGVGAEMSFASPATGRADGFEVVVQFARSLQRGQGSAHGS